MNTLPITFSVTVNAFSTSMNRASLNSSPPRFCQKIPIFSYPNISNFKFQTNKANITNPG